LRARVSTPRDASTTIAAGSACPARVVTRVSRASLCVPPDLRSEIVVVVVRFRPKRLFMNFISRVVSAFVFVVGASRPITTYRKNAESSAPSGNRDGREVGHERGGRRETLCAPNEPVKIATSRRRLFFFCARVRPQDAKRGLHVRVVARNVPHT
jgi:hypothetical protein